MDRGESDAPAAEDAGADGLEKAGDGVAVGAREKETEAGEGQTTKANGNGVVVGGAGGDGEVLSSCEDLVRMRDQNSAPDRANSKNAPASARTRSHGSGRVRRGRSPNESGNVRFEESIGDNAFQSLVSVARQAVVNRQASNVVGVLHLNQEEKHRISKLESLSATQMAWLQFTSALAFLFFLIYTATITGLANKRWNDDPQEATNSEWFNFIFMSVMCAAELVLWVLYARQIYLYIRRKRHRRLRTDAWWVFGLLFPVSVLWNNPGFNVDRTSFLVDHISSSAASGLAITRYFLSAASSASYLLYILLKLGSVERKEVLHDPYSKRFYLMRGVPTATLFVVQFLLSFFYRVELSPLPFVSLFTLIREKVDQGATIATVVVGVLNVLIVLIFFQMYRWSGQRIQGVAYHRARQKHLQRYFLFRNTVVLLGLTTLVTLVCSTVFSPDLVDAIRVDGKYVEHWVLNLPFYARAGIKGLFAFYAGVEAWAVLPGKYRPSWVEKQVMKLVQLDLGDHREPSVAQSAGDLEASNSEHLESQATADSVANDSAFRDVGLPLVWDTPADRWMRNRKSNLAKFVMEENVACFDLSWLVYLDDESIKSIALTDFPARGLYLDGVWRVPNQDLTFLVAHTKHVIFIAFRGTVTLANWKVNARFRQSQHIPFEDPEWVRGKWKTPRLGAKEPMVHRGFQAAYRSLRGDAIEAVQRLHSEFRASNALLPLPRVLCTGHSLGGALATLCAFDMRCTLGLSPHQISLYTYGSPKVGNRPFARRFSAAIPHSFRVVNRSDGVTNAPKSVLDNYEHVPRAVLLDENGNLIIDPVFSDVQFFHGNGALPHLMGSYKEHFQRFIDRTESGWVANWVDFDNLDPETLQRVDAANAGVYQAHQPLPADLHSLQRRMSIVGAFMAGGQNSSRQASTGEPSRTSERARNAPPGASTGGGGGGGFGVGSGSGTQRSPGGAPLLRRKERSMLFQRGDGQTADETRLRRISSPKLTVPSMDTGNPRFDSMDIILSPTGDEVLSP